MSDIYQWIGSSNASVGSASNWADESNPGMGTVPGTNDVAIIQVGQGIYGVMNVDALDIVQASGAPPISITGQATAITAATIGIAFDFDLDDGAFLQAGTLAIDGSDTAVTVQNGAYLYAAGGENDNLDIGATSGDCSVVVTKGGLFTYASTGASGTLNIGDYADSDTTLTLSGGAYFDSTLAQLSIGAVAGSAGHVVVTGAGTQFLADDNGYTNIGDFGEQDGSSQGTFTVTNGAYASLIALGEMDIGTTGGMAKVLVSGANSDISAGPYVEIGIFDSNIAGEILVQAGGEFDVATDPLLNNGMISVTGANSLFLGRILSADAGTSVKVGNGGAMRLADIQLGGNLTLTAGTVDVRALLYLYAGAKIVGAGVITATSITNNASIAASDGTLSLTGAFSGTGSEVIYAGATLELDGPVVATQTISFTGANAVLKVAQATSFKARVTKFVAGDKLDLTGVAFAAGAKATLGATHILNLHDGSFSAGFYFGATDASTYTVVSDGHGGTEILAATGSASVPAFTQAMASFGRSGAGQDLFTTSVGRSASALGAHIVAPAEVSRHAV